MFAYNIRARAACSFIIICLVLVVATLTSTAAAPMPRTALIINKPNPSGDTPTTFSATLKATLNNATTEFSFYDETGEMSRFDESNQEAILRTYIMQKYGDVRFGIIVAVGA